MYRQSIMPETRKLNCQEDTHLWNRKSCHQFSLYPSSCYVYNWEKENSYVLHQKRLGKFWGEGLIHRGRGQFKPVIFSCTYNSSVCGGHKLYFTAFYEVLFFWNQCEISICFQLLKSYKNARIVINTGNKF